ncbi:MAG: Peptidase M50 [Candidatus Uhrbacteria bacterium GW2011_GWD2_52_7]|uniref:Peptidase M50 n=1 Tax=Candidatus Uhrbacteria bacterium GW2011_GWD2_52_7 TaxID=1618989 RepID=A0A0G1XF13_9BACT|nr:MAG: Peptidase M50 [Candidatus Uhrbacteria bacterium GW2011_GWD2_52_7]
MLFNLLLQAPLIGIVWIAAIVIALTVHEFAHALVGSWRGDSTAEDMGRLTLNPLAHIDIFGFMMLIVIGFGWAKPVPFDPRNLRNPLKDGLLIALAGPAANLVLAALAALAFRGLFAADLLNFETMLAMFLVLLVFVNLLLFFFNLVPIYPLDGSKVLDVVLPGTRLDFIRQWLMMYGPRVLLALVIISLLTNFNPFGVIQVPAALLCSTLIGMPCGF